jgi:purine-binding chemotaxis protein CheW
MAKPTEGRKKGTRKAEPPRSGAAWRVREEPLTFPAEMVGGPGRARISLPSSGLAAEILARPDAALVESPSRSALVTSDAELAPAAETGASRVHNLSFFAAPMREEKQAVEATEHLVSFFLEGEEYAIDVRLVQEIIRVTEITQVPRAPEFIKGVINLRGRIIPVIDLKLKLGLGEVEIARQTRVVVVRLRERLIGLLVDGASQVLKVPVSSIEAAPEEVVEIAANYIRGVAKLAARLLILVDLQKILGVELHETQAVAAGTN